ncbi:MAG: carbohydrate kinase family protein [Candidatus Bathyarchaeia archaeon]
MSLDIISIGDCVVDLIIQVKKLPINKESDITAKGIRMQCGGVCNFLIMASRLGLKVGAIDRVGDDYYGKFIIDTLKEENTDTSHIHITNGKSSTSVIAIVDTKGNHAFIGAFGASMLLSPKDIDFEYIKNSKFIYASGYTMIFSKFALKATIKAIRLAKKSCIPIIFDPSPLLMNIPKNVLNEVIASSKIVLMNENESKILTKKRSPIEAGKEILKKGCEIVAIKLGVKGCLVYTNNAFEIVPGFKVKVIDTTGAGDSFNAAFIFALMKDLSIKDAAIFANAIGAIKVQKLGAGKNVPKKQEIINFLIKHKLEKFMKLL